MASKPQLAATLPEPPGAASACRSRASGCARFEPRLALLLGWLVALTFTACSTASRKVVAFPEPRTNEASLLTKEEMELRIEALARYSAGISSDLKDQPEDALEHLFKSLQADASNEALAIEVARRFMRKKEPEKAVEALSLAARHPGASGMLDAFLGLALMQTGQPEQAVLVSRRAIGKLPRSIIGYRNLMQVFLQSNRPPEALHVLDEAALIPDPDIVFLLDLAEAFRSYVQVQPKEFESIKPRVLRLIEEADKLKPTAQALQIRLAEGLRFVGEFSRAAQLYLSLLERFPNQPLFRERLIDLHLRANDHQAARAQLEKVLRDNPTNPQINYLLGAIASEQKEWDKAADFYAKTIQLNSAFEPVYYELAFVHISRNKPEDALKLLAQTRDKFKASFILEFYTALAHSQAKNYAQCVRYFTSAELLAKRDEPARLTHFFYFQAGAAFERHKDYRQAEAYFRECLKLSPDFADALNYLGYMWAERGENLEEAKVMIEKALKQEPESGAYLDSLAWVLYKLKRPKEALEWQLKALKFTKEPDATLHDHLGDIHAALGQIKQAREEWEKALSLEPSDEIRRKLTPTPGPSR